MSLLKFDALFLHHSLILYHFHSPVHTWGLYFKTAWTCLYRIIPETTRASLGPQTTNPHVMILKLPSLQNRRVTRVFTRVFTRFLTSHSLDDFPIHFLVDALRPITITTHWFNSQKQRPFDPRGSSNTYWIDGWLLQQRTEAVAPLSLLPTGGSLTLSRLLLVEAGFQGTS